MANALQHLELNMHIEFCYTNQDSILISCVVQTHNFIHHTLYYTTLHCLGGPRCVTVCCDTHPDAMRYTVLS